MTLQEFQNDIRAGIPDRLPAAKPYDRQINHAPKRKEILTPEEQVLAIKNALRYFPAKHHALLAKEFAEELRKYGRIYMYRLRPDYEMYARPIDQYPCKCRQAAAIMLMIQNNLDKAVAQHPHEPDHLRRQRRGIPELGAVPSDDEIPLGDDRLPDAGDVFGPSAGAVPVAPRRSARGGDQRHGDSQLLETRRLGAHERPRRVAVRTDDRGFLYVYRTAGHRSRDDHHGDERRPQTFHRRSPRRPRHALRLVGTGRHVGRAAQGGDHFGRGERHRRDQPQGGAEALRAGLGR